MKTCTVCGTVKPLDEYHRDKRSSDGRRSRCKSCVLEYHVEYRARPEVKARQAEYMAEYHAEHREARREYNAQYYSENRDAILAQSSEYYRENRDAALAQAAKYRSSPEGKARSAAYRAENRERLRELSRKYQAENPHLAWRRNTARRAKEFGYTPTLDCFTRADVVAKYGDECWHCKAAPFEELDHYPVPISRGGDHVIENVRPSCSACNHDSWRQP